VTNVIQLILADFAAESVSVDSEGFGSAGLISVKAFQHTLDEFFFEFRNRFFEQDAPLNHHSYQRFQLIFHDCTLRSDARAKIC
jgi:hypothetical protein